MQPVFDKSLHLFGANKKRLPFVFVIKKWSNIFSAATTFGSRVVFVKDCFSRGCDYNEFTGFIFFLDCGFDVGGQISPVTAATTLEAAMVISSKIAEQSQIKLMLKIKTKVNILLRYG